MDEFIKVKALSKNETVTITLYSLNSTIALKTWGFKNNQTIFNQNLSGLMYGHFILQVQKGKYKQSEQMIIE